MCVCARRRGTRNIAGSGLPVSLKNERTNAGAMENEHTKTLKITKSSFAGRAWVGRGRLAEPAKQCKGKQHRRSSKVQSTAAQVCMEALVCGMVHKIELDFVLKVFTGWASCG